MVASRAGVSAVLPVVDERDDEEGRQELEDPFGVSGRRLDWASGTWLTLCLNAKTSPMPRRQ